MAIDRSSLQALKNLIAEADLILETTSPLPEKRSGAARENLRAALALTDDMLKSGKMTAAASGIGEQWARCPAMVPDTIPSGVLG